MNYMIKQRIKDLLKPKEIDIDYKEYCDFHRMYETILGV